jgi:adenosylcobinamide-GDP ribazoletransferase
VGNWLAGLLTGLRLAVSTFTVAPVRPGRVDRGAAATAMALAPFVGLVLGGVLGLAAFGLRTAGAPALLAGVLVTALAALLTRGLHLDGLADTVDALGSYRDAERALEIMKKPDVGPFGVAAIGFALLVPAVAVAALLVRPWPALVAGIAAATGTGRLAVTWACRRGVPAARPDGLGALVAGTVPAWAAVVGTLAVAAVAVPAVPGRPWQGPLAGLAGLAAALLLTRHAVRRLGGITGDVLGACVEVAAAVCYAVLAMSG